MRRIALLLFILTLAGCKSTSGPFAASRQKDKNPDPLLTSEPKHASNRERTDPGDSWYLPPQNLNGSSSQP